MLSLLCIVCTWYYPWCADRCVFRHHRSCLCTQRCHWVTFPSGTHTSFLQMYGLPLGTRLVLQPFLFLYFIISYTCAYYGSRKAWDRWHTIAAIIVCCQQMAKNELSVDCRTINFLNTFLWSHAWNNFNCTCLITSHMLGWINITSAFVVVVPLPRLFAATRF